jgi:cell division protein FtsA
MVTKDIALGKTIATDTAERIKLSAGACWEGSLADDRSGTDVIIPGVGGRPPMVIARSELCYIIRARVEQILMLVKQEVTRLSDVKVLGGNIVLTGGGALMPGIVELTREVFNTDAVRIGYPANLGETIDDYHSPEWATCTGILMSAMSKRRAMEDEGPAPRHNWRIGDLFKFFRGFF